MITETKERPILNKKLDSSIFRDYYYLKEELVAFCRANKLPTSGSKGESTDRIANFLDTGKVQKAESKSKRAVMIGNIGNKFSFKVAFQKWLKANAGNIKKQQQGHNRYEKLDLVVLKL